VPIQSLLTIPFKILYAIKFGFDDKNGKFA